MDKAALRTAIANDLRDPAFATFGSDEVDGYMADGIVEISLAYPLQIVEIVSPVAATYYYPIRCESVFRAEMYEDDSFKSTLSMSDGDSQSGLDIHAGTLWVPKALLDNMDVGRDDIRLWGYCSRKVPQSDAEVLELDDRAVSAVRTYARWIAYQALVNDRSLFKQWQVQSKNTDISINQLLQTVNLYAREWDRKRASIRTVRRVAD